MEKKRILILAPHTDDGEFGCGGAINKLSKQVNEVIYVAFSAAEDSVVPPYPRDILRQEVKAATQVLGIAKENCHVLSFEVRKFPEHRQEILDAMISLGKEYRPDIVFVPSMHDTHQDHAVIAQEGFRAFKKTTMLGYEVPWNNLDFRTSCFYVLDEEDVLNKVNALKCYQSQQHRSYATEEFVRSLAITRGTQIGQRYAEVFEVIRMIHF